MEAGVETSDRTGPLAAVPTWGLVVGALALIAAVLVALAVAGGDSLPERTGPPVEELAVERTQLTPGEIELPSGTPVRTRSTWLRSSSTTPTPTSPARTSPSTGSGRRRSTIDFPWLDGQPYLVSMVTSTGVVIEHEIAAAVETPAADGSLFGLMALLGTYVGIVPVVLGMALLPAMRRFSTGWVRVLMAFTVGLLAFLAVDATLEGLDLAAGSAGAFGGAELLFLGAGISFLLLVGLDRYLSGGGPRRPDRPRRAAGSALMIAIGIGLHNLGEGLAIGSAYAIGELALGAFLVVGFAIHNTTEGFAIVAPLARERRPSAGRGCSGWGPSPAARRSSAPCSAPPSPTTSCPCSCSGSASGQSCR